MDDHLIASWTRCWKGSGASGDGFTTYAALLARYSEPHRHYHTMQHLAECLSAFRSVSASVENPAEVGDSLSGFTMPSTTSSDRTTRNKAHRGPDQNLSPTE